MSGHVHSMTPDPKRPGVHVCSSCAFACTSRALPRVESSPSQHRAIKRVRGVKPKVWDQP